MKVSCAMRRAAGAALIAAVLVFGTLAPAEAGDPRRYADRGEWPEWAAEYFPGAPPGSTPIDGELVDAIRFELIRGYPVEPQDYMQYEDREFRPFREMTRAEFAAVLSRSQGLAAEDGAEVWYAPYVAALREAGIIPADAGDDWSAPITRREAGQWMGRAAEHFGADERQDVPEFVDVQDPLILRALRAGIVKGTGQQRYEPDRALLRVEAALMVLRLARARNAHVEPGTDEALVAVIKEADRQATERVRRWAEQGHIDPVETGGVRTQEYADYIYYWARAARETVPDREFAWSVRLDEDYQFEFPEVHDSVAVVLSCGVDRFFRLSDPPDQPWFEEEFCGRVFLVKRGDQWLISATARPELDYE